MKDLSLYDGCAVLYIHTFLPAHPSRLRRATTTTPVQRQLLCSRGCPIPVLQRRNRVAYSSSWSVIHFIVIAKLLLVQNNQNGQSSRRCAPDLLGGSVAHLHLKGAPIIDMGETPQVAAAGTLVTMSPRSRQAPPLSIHHWRRRSLGASPEGPHCGTLKSVYIGQRRLKKEGHVGATVPTLE